MPLSRSAGRTGTVELSSFGFAVRYLSLALVKNSQTIGSAMTNQNRPNPTQAIRHPKWVISRSVSRGMKIEQMLLPHNVTASANPRPAENRLVTAAVQTDGCTRIIPRLSGNHKAHQFHMLGPVWPRRVKAKHTVITAARPIRLGPSRSTNRPVKGAHIVARIAATELPDMICARLQPNS